MPRVFLRPAARADLQEIARYTERTWGRRQRDLYLTAIDVKLDALAADPKIGASRDALRAGYRSSRVGAHIVFYREVPEGIEVVRILHERMDVRRPLAPEDDDA
jgi:toxin ParE1/3/4